LGALALGYTARLESTNQLIFCEGRAMRAKVLGHLRGNAIAYLALFVALGGVGYAAIPDSGGVVHGCYDTSPGAGVSGAFPLYVIDTSSLSSCPMGRSAQMTALNWNMAGPQGQQGSPGTVGPQGPPGPTGLTARSGLPLVFPTGKLDMFLTVKGLKGASTKLKGAFDLQSYSWGPKTLTMTKKVGTDDPALLLATAAGTTFTEAHLEIQKPGKQFTEDAVMKPAIVASYGFLDAAHSQSQFQISFGKLTNVKLNVNGTKVCQGSTRGRAAALHLGC
jgi:hypothetical protein